MDLPGRIGPQEIHTCDGHAVKRVAIRAERILRAISIGADVSLERQPETHGHDPSRGTVSMITSLVVISFDTGQRATAA